MLAAMNGHKDVVLILTQKGADLNLVNNVSVHVHTLYDNSCISKIKMYLFLNGSSYYTIIIKFEILSLNNMPNIMNIGRKMIQSIYHNVNEKCIFIRCD